MTPIVDLHCDLLEYLAHQPGRTPYDPACPASYPQLKAGGVSLQTTAIFCETQQGSVAAAQRQIDCFHHLLKQCPIQLIPSIENASACAEENEPLSNALARLERWAHDLQKIAYISLTWNGENRFGGGTGSEKGLTGDGKTLLDWMQTKHIPVDMSHASDRLAEEVLDYIDAQGLALPVLASHSNFREVCPHTRNLPAWLCQEIIRRKGVIGLNLFAPFIHPTDPTALVRHVEYALSLNAHDTLCFGADFFHVSDFPVLLKRHQCKNAFFPEYADASCYPAILEMLGAQLNLPAAALKKLAHGNALRFLKHPPYKSAMSMIR